MSRKKSTIGQKTLKKFGERLFILRKSTGMSQRAFSKTIGISANYVSYLENGLSTPSKTVLQSIKSQYLINFDEIFLGMGLSLEKLEKYSPIKENKEEIFINDKKTGYNEDRDKKKDILLQKAAEVLDSNTEYARALETNIHAFHKAIKDDEKHEDLRERIENLEKKEYAGNA